MFPYLSQNERVQHNDLKKDAINEFGIKYWTSSPVWVIFQEHGSFFYVNIEEKVWLLKIYRRRLKITGRLKFRFWGELERLQSREGDFVAQVASFGEPCLIRLYFFWLKSTKDFICIFLLALNYKSDLYQ